MHVTPTWNHIFVHYITTRKHLQYNFKKPLIFFSIFFYTSCSTLVKTWPLELTVNSGGNESTNQSTITEREECKATSVKWRIVKELQPNKRCKEVLVRVKECLKGEGGVQGLSQVTSATKPKPLLQSALLLLKMRALLLLLLLTRSL